MMLAARSVSIARGGRRILDDVSLALEPGAVTVVIGPNGSGKSTLLRVLAGTLAPDAGAVTLDGAPLASFGVRTLAARRAVLAQERESAFAFTVRELVALGVQCGARARDAAATAAMVSRAIALVGLADLAQRPTDRLSGGERQRAHLARALVQLWTGGGREGAGALLLDEPLSAQDLHHQIAILDLARTHAAGGGSVMMILHDINAAVRAADRLVVLHRGRIAADGPPVDVVTGEMLAEVFAVDLPPCTVPDASVPFVLSQVALPVALPSIPHT